MGASWAATVWRRAMDELGSFAWLPEGGHAYHYPITIRKTVVIAKKAADSGALTLGADIVGRLLSGETLFIAPIGITEEGHIKLAMCYGARGEAVGNTVSSLISGPLAATIEGIAEAEVELETRARLAYALGQMGFTRRGAAVNVFTGELCGAPLEITLPANARRNPVAKVMGRTTTGKDGLERVSRELEQMVAAVSEGVASRFSGNVVAATRLNPAPLVRLSPDGKHGRKANFLVGGVLVDARIRCATPRDVEIRGDFVSHILEGWEGLCVKLAPRGDGGAALTVRRLTLRHGDPNLWYTFGKAVLHGIVRAEQEMRDRVEQSGGVDTLLWLGGHGFKPGRRNGGEGGNGSFEVIPDGAGCDPDGGRWWLGEVGSAKLAIRLCDGDFEVFCADPAYWGKHPNVYNSGAICMNMSGEASGLPSRLLQRSDSVSTHVAWAAYVLEHPGVGAPTPDYKSNKRWPRRRGR